MFWRSTPHTYLALGKPRAKGAIGFCHVSIFYFCFSFLQRFLIMRYDILAFPSVDSVTNIIGCYLYHRAKYNALSDQVEVPHTRYIGLLQVLLSCIYNMCIPNGPTWEFPDFMTSPIPYNIQRLHPGTTPTLTYIYIYVRVCEYSYDAYLNTSSVISYLT